jgi:hypothetical protein
MDTLAAMLEIISFPPESELPPRRKTFTEDVDEWAVDVAGDEGLDPWPTDEDVNADSDFDVDLIPDYF